MLYGAVLRAPVEGSVPDKIDDAKAKAVPGVTAVVRLPHGVGVVAETAWAAFTARQALIGVRHLDPDRHGLGLRQRQGARRLRGRCEEPQRGRRATGARKATPAAHSRTPPAWSKAEYRCDYAYHAQMEPLNAVASVAPAGDAVEIWAGTQSQTTATEAPAKLLGISRDKVKLHDLLMGGGFGRRGNRDVDFIIDAVMLSKEVEPAGQGDVDARGRRAQRPVPAAVGALPARRLRCLRASSPHGIIASRRIASRRSWIRCASRRAAAGTAW